MPRTNPVYSVAAHDGGLELLMAHSGHDVCAAHVCFWPEADIAHPGPSLAVGKGETNT